MRGSEATLNPASSTYYSHRVFMIYEPDDFRGYLGKIVAGPDWREKEQARHLMAWGTILVYQARMDPFAFNECMNRYIDEERKFRDRYEAETPNSDPMFRMQLTMQLALEAVTRRANIMGQIDDDPARAQLVFDTLYYVAFLHALDRRPGDRRPDKQPNEQPYDFHVDKADLQDYLRRRAESDRGSGLPADFPGDDVCTFLFRLFREYVDLLSKPEEIRERTVARQNDPRIGKLWEDLAFGTLDEKVITLGESANAGEIRFSFRMDRYGVNPDEPDPLVVAAKAAEALGAWESLLRKLLGDPAEAARIVAEVRLIDSFPEWDPVSEARRRTLQTVKADAPATLSAARADSGDRELRRAALVMRDYLRMLDQWSKPFARGCIAATLAAAAGTGEPAARRRIAFEALRVLCGLDPREPPEEIDRMLAEQFDAKAWPTPFDTHLEAWPTPFDTRLPAESGRSASFAEDPESLTNFCGKLSEAISSFDAKIESPNWAAIWTKFWAQWGFLTTVDAERVDLKNPFLALDLLHTVRHGAIPVMPKQRGNLSIGEWCRILTLVWSSEKSPQEDEVKAASEKSPQEDAVKAALSKLDFPKEANERLPDRAEHEPPILLISVVSTRSPAWQWRPQPEVVRALMLMPADIVAAEGWPREDHPEAAEQILLRPGLRAQQILHCIETGLDLRPRYEPVYFGSGLPPKGADRYIANPTSVADLAERLRRDEAPKGGLALWWRWVGRRFRQLLGVKQQHSR